MSLFCANRRLFRYIHQCLIVAVTFSVTAVPHASAQTESATVLGRVTDQSGAVIRGAEVAVRNIDTSLSVTTTTNGEGLYAVPALRPGRYVISVRKQGFRSVSLTQLDLNVQDNVVRNFALQVGSASESITVTAESQKINTSDASVSTVVDRNFAENMPLNGRSFQTLIDLTPGVVLTPSTANDGGQFSVNGQRAESNYWMVDGVSANIGMSSNNIAGNGFGGSLASFTVLGGTNSLVSVDAMQEFRIQTSTYAPEFGRTPGGQISILTRSGTNQFHGTLFDYLRNDVLDANDWFANYLGLPKPPERQNDFGGTFSGPILRDKTFFFFSYEGLRLRLPVVALSNVPDLNARQNAIPALQPFLNAFPQPNGSDNLSTGVAQFNSSFSNRASLDAYSLRVDHNLTSKVTIFGRYNYSPSEIVGRGNGHALSTLIPSSITTQTGTAGLTWGISPITINDLRFNFSRNVASSICQEDNFGDGVPLVSPPFPNSLTSESALFQFRIISLNNLGLCEGKQTQNRQNQANIVDTVSTQTGRHSLKFGIDFRRLAPLFGPNVYDQEPFFSNVSSAENGNIRFTVLTSTHAAALLFRNIGLFAQDTWRVTSRATLTYGVRWDLDFAPSSANGPNLPAVVGFNLSNLTNLGLAPTGTSPFNTTYGNVAPRVGLAYQLRQSHDTQTVLRGGFGVFYDLVTSEAGNDLNSCCYPFGAAVRNIGGTFPLSTAAAAPPQIVPPSASNNQTLFAFDPRIELPYSLEWSAAVEQELGRDQTLSLSYIGSVGRRLIQSSDISSPNANLSQAILIGNTASSDYHALQAQVQRRLSRGLQALASYTFSHSIDNASAGSYANNSNLLQSATNPNANRGSSDFDVRHSFSAGITYEIPGIGGNTFAKAIANGWSLQSLVLARSAVPIDVIDPIFSQLDSGVQAAIRPDIVPGQSIYLFGTNCASVEQSLGNLAPGQGCPGGKAFNPAAFQDPPLDPLTGNPTRQGNVPRNFLRGFGATQWDFAAHREFPIRESIKLQFRAEMFNILNHPNFGPLSGAFTSLANGGPAGFGLSTQMLGQSLNGGASGLSNAGSGALGPLYQIGGPRSIQFALKLSF